MFLVDTLSQAFPVSETVRDDPEMLNIVDTISKHLPMSEKRRAQFKKETELDLELQVVVKYIKEGKFNSPTYFQSAPKRGQDSLLCRLDEAFKSNGIEKQKAVGERD
ncbi:transposon Tf2-6 polyprotein [Trichonephila clavipes]|nr:transposon Tf2-6 polyprotein [Trichonephila clavipes]